MSSTPSSTVCCDHKALIRKQFVRIEQLEKEIALLKLERDSLAQDNDKLLFQLQMLNEANNFMKTKENNGGIKKSANQLRKQTLEEETFLESKQRNEHFFINFCEDTNFMSNDNQSNASESQKQSSLSYEEEEEEEEEEKCGETESRRASIVIQRAFRKYLREKEFKETIQRQLSRSGNTQDSLETKNEDFYLEKVEQKRYSNLTTSSDSSNSSNSLQNISQMTFGRRLTGSSSLSALSKQQEVFGEEKKSNPNRREEEEFELLRKRQYRVSLNLFNKEPPSRGIQYLILNKFLPQLRPGVNEQEFYEHLAQFLLTRKGLSKEMIGKYLAAKSSAPVLSAFLRLIDFKSLPVDVALRKFQTFFRFPGEAQLIERLVESFASRYHQQNGASFKVKRDSESCLEQSLDPDEIFILSFAIIMLNTDLHSPQNRKTRMTCAQWLKNLKGVFKKGDLDSGYLTEIYERVKQCELRTGLDHCSQVLKVQQSLVNSSGKPVGIPRLCFPWRRIVCFCRLYEVQDKHLQLTKMEPHLPSFLSSSASSVGSYLKHQREVFLFNDLVLVTKISRKTPPAPPVTLNSSSNNLVMFYVYKYCISLSGLQVKVFSSLNYKHGIQLVLKKEEESQVYTFNARNDLDRIKFVADLQESISEVKEMETVLRNQEKLFHKILTSTTGGEEGKKEAFVKEMTRTT